jgi:hypothetical protein
MTETKEEIKKLENDLSNINYKPIHSPLKGFKTKSGEVISYKEALRRWKEGMRNLTPAQRTQNDLNAIWITLIGFIVSIIALLFFNKTFGLVTYGLIIIFIGSIYANVIKLFSLQGQLKLYKDIERQINQTEVNNGS